ncbi:hypothetical protein BCR43DRAFT_498523 [Syncephalastrum racemosum]|uniref:OTU domain-containing protein n=1 Tax=Syncephalastrum racemosum TaxID=13706 RepID=A0A1X2H272_SYNRA|nr:hypothetical protein BCR43DRAFT_498523 [Syncephalastrum racemosum]
MAKGKTKGGKAHKTHADKKQTRKKGKTTALFDADSVDLEGQLRDLQLCIKDMTGDGNCLFRALSDQFHGDPSQHKAIRAQVCDYLREHEDEYKFFVEDDLSFDHHLSRMEKDGTFGGNMELAAFARLKGIDIKVYQPGLIYIISGNEGQEEVAYKGDDDGEDMSRPSRIHIAYHSWEHYSSVRALDGPWTGPPEIKEDEIKGTAPEDNEEEGSASMARNSKEKIVLESCPGTSLVKIRRLLRKHKGDPDEVINALYEEEYGIPDIKAEDAEEDIMPTPAQEQQQKEETELTVDIAANDRLDNALRSCELPVSPPPEPNKSSMNEDIPNGEDAGSVQSVQEGAPKDNDPSPSPPSPPSQLGAADESMQPKKHLKKPNKRDKKKEKREEKRLKRQSKAAAAKKVKSDDAAEDTTTTMRQLYI